MSQLQPRKFHHIIQVQESDIDEMGHVNNVVYLRWVQEVATAHWHYVAPESMRQRFAWVVLRHEIDYLKPAFAGDEISGYTWVIDPHGAKVERFVNLYRKDSEELLAKAKTTWCLIDAGSMRPRRIETDMIRTFEDFIQK